MRESVGAIEFNSIARGIRAADAMAKAAAVTVFTAKTICPGKFAALVHGDVSAVNASVDAGKADGEGAVVDWFVIPSVHAQVIPALMGTAEVDPLQAVGIVESYSALTGVLAGDAAAKAATVDLVEIRFANGIGGKSVLILSGSVADVEAAVRAGEDAIAHTGLFVASVVIPAPHADLKLLLS